MQIRPMVFFILIFTSVLPFLFFSKWLFSSYSEKIENLLAANLKTVTMAQTKSLELFFLNVNHEMAVIGDSQTVHDWVASANQEALDRGVMLRPFIDDILRTQVDEYNYLESMTLLDKNFRIIACSVGVPTGQFSKIKSMNFTLTPEQTLFTSIAPPQASSHNKAVLAAIRPICSANDIVEGYLIAEINLEYFEDLRRAVPMLETQTICLLDSKGNIVTAGNQNVSRTEYLQQKLDTKDFYQQWGDREVKEPGSIKYQSAGIQYLSYYAPILDTDWRLFVSIDLDAMLLKENDVFNLEIGLWVVIVLMLVAGNYFLSARLVYPVERLISQVRQISNAHNFQLRIRRMPKNEIGEIAKAFNELLSDIEQRANDLWKSKEKYSIVISRTDHIFFERDYKNGDWFVSNKFEEIFGYPFPFSKLTEAEGLAQWVHDEDRRRYCDWLLNSYQADKYMQIEVRMKKWDGTFFWVRFILLPVKDDDGKVAASVGLIKDIDEEKSEVEKLRTKAQFDQLTGVLNKGALEEKLRQFLGNNKACVLFFIDIDDFRDFNTKYGHLGGDQVLQFVAQVLKLHISGVVGRNGGDEFIACLAATDPQAQSEICAKAILEAFAKGTMINGNEENVAVHCSIGIALYPQTANNYEEILSKADDAMYEVKSMGKNNYYIIK